MIIEYEWKNDKHEFTFFNRDKTRCACYYVKEGTGYLTLDDFLVNCRKHSYLNESNNGS